MPMSAWLDRHDVPDGWVVWRAGVVSLKMQMFQF